MQQTPNLELNKFELNDSMKTTTREGLNDNADTIDAAIGDLSSLITEHTNSLVAAINDAAENGGIAVQAAAPTNSVLAWVDSDANGADFCFVGSSAPLTDGSVALWVDTSEDEIPLQANNVSYDNTSSSLLATTVQGAIDEVNQNLNGIVKTMEVSGTTNSTGNFYISLPPTSTPILVEVNEGGNMGILFKSGGFYIKVIKFNTTTYTPVVNATVTGTVYYI